MALRISGKINLSNPNHRKPLICYAPRILIPSGQPRLYEKTNQKGWFFRHFLPMFVPKSWFVSLLRSASSINDCFLSRSRLVESIHGKAKILLKLLRALYISRFISKPHLNFSYPMLNLLPLPCAWLCLQPRYMQKPPHEVGHGFW